jgi:hypothetical protein
MAKLTGKKGLVKVSGSPLTLTSEATTDAGDHLNYQITNTAKRVLDPTAAVTVKENGVTTTQPYTINRLNGKVTFTDVAPFFTSATVGDGAWTAGGTPTRTPAAFTCYDGTPLDLIGDADVGTADNYFKPLSFTGNGSKDIRFRIAKSSSFAAHRVYLSDATASADRLAVNIDFTTATPAVTIVSGPGILVSVTALGDGSFDVVVTAGGVLAANVNNLAFWPGGVVASDMASIYVGLVKAYDSPEQRGGAVAVTVSGSYLPQSTALSSNDWTLTLTGTNADVTDFDTVGGFVERLAVFKDASGSIKGFRNTLFAGWETALLAGGPILLALYTNSANAPDFLLWALLNKQQLQAALKSAQTQSIDFEGAADADNRVISAP